MTTRLAPSFFQLLTRVILPIGLTASLLVGWVLPNVLVSRNLASLSKAVYASQPLPSIRRCSTSPKTRVGFSLHVSPIAVCLTGEQTRLTELRRYLQHVSPASAISLLPTQPPSRSAEKTIDWMMVMSASQSSAGQVNDV